MTINEARNIQDEFHENQNPTEEEVFLFIEAMNFLIDEECNPADMLSLKIYEEGLGVEKDMDKAIEFYKRAILDCEFLSDKGDEHYEKVKARLTELGVEIRETV
jgi:prefoldin subunit 5